MVRIAIVEDEKEYQDILLSYMERWQSQSRDERLKDAWDHHNSFEIRPDQGGIPRLNIPLNTMLFLTVIMIIVVIAMRFL